MSQQLDSFDNVQCEEVYRDDVFGEVSFADNSVSFRDYHGIVWDLVDSPADPDTIIPYGLISDPPHLCFRDEFGYCHEFSKIDISFLSDYLRISSGVWHTPGYFAILRDLLSSGF